MRWKGVGVSGSDFEFFAGEGDVEWLDDDCSVVAIFLDVTGGPGVDVVPVGNVLDSPHFIGRCVDSEAGAHVEVPVHLPCVDVALILDKTENVRN